MPEATGLSRTDQHRGTKATAFVLSLTKERPIASTTVMYAGITASYSFYMLANEPRKEEWPSRMVVRHGAMFPVGTLGFKARGHSGFRIQVSRSRKHLFA